YTNMFNYFELNAVILDDPWWKLWGGIRANAGISSVWLGCTNEQTNIINEKILLTEAGNLKILSVKPDTSDIGQEVAISGRGFGKDRIANLVYFNSIPAVEYSLWNDTLITVKVPLGAVSGKIYVSVNGINSNTLDIRIFVPSRPFGQLWAWGNNEFGQLGDSTNILSYEPVKINPLWNCVAASAGMSYSLAINTYGKLYSWGNNSGGELGNGYTGNRNNPGQIGNAEDKWSFISASAFYSNSLGVTEEGWMLGWGRNDYGQVGDGTRQPKYSPIQIWGHDWAKVSVRGFHTLAITTDGKLYAWGRNNYGQLGDSSFFDSLIPERIGKDQTWVSVSAGNSHSLAISSEGRLYGWGLNNKGQVGNNSSETTIVPTRLGNGTNWAVVCAGDDNSFAITKDGKLYGWGDNYHYQLGGNNNYDKAAPTLIVSNVKWAKVSAGSWHTMAITTDGKLYGWGDNTYGQIGDGTDILRTFPERVGSDNGWLDVSAGNIHTLGIRK
ncbi:MAG: hypothetical protein QG635_1926, partial [Bacteroidota bacterium]|nr:hypothetical protein [Bacteroidota bacterium]